MTHKSLILIGIVSLTIIIIGSYFLFAASNTSAVKILSYSFTDKEKPKAQVDESLKDLSTIKVSEQKEAIFVLKNSGQKPLQLSNVSSSCGCTVGKIIIDGKESKEYGMHSQSDYVGEIAAGKEAKVIVIYRPYVMPVYGVVEREVYMATNDPENPKLTFKVKAYVK